MGSPCQQSLARGSINLSRISRGEAASDSTIKLAMAYKNGDGYLAMGPGSSLRRKAFR
jgi:hypothetical protein